MRLTDTDPKEGTETIQEDDDRGVLFEVSLTPTRKRVLKHFGVKVAVTVSEVSLTPTRKRVLKLVAAQDAAALAVGLTDTDPKEGTETGRMGRRCWRRGCLTDTDPKEGTETAVCP